MPCSPADAYEEIAAQYARNADYYRGLLLEVAAHLGPEVYVQDDGGTVDHPLLAKVPELVKRLVEDRDCRIFARKDGAIYSACIDGERESGPGPAYVDLGIEWDDYLPDEPVLGRGHIVDGPMLVVDGAGSVTPMTIRDCLGCGCLVPGGPTRCKRCAAEASPAKAVDRMVTGEVVPPVTMLDLQKEAHATAREKGWWDDETRPDGSLDMADVRHLVPTKLAMVHSEVSEALEDYRVGKMLTTFRDEDGKPEGFGSELADVIIRIFDLAEALDLNMEAEVKAKMSHNRCRSHRHGGKTC